MSWPFSAGDIQTETWTFRDAKGNTSRFSIYIDFNATTLANAASFASTMQPLLTAVTNAALQTSRGVWSEYGVAQYGAHVSSGAYESVIEKAVLVFQDNSGQLHRFQIPAPKISIFLADKITVDPANSAVLALTNYMTTTDANGVFLCSRSDIKLVNYMGGYFRAAKIRRRANVYVLTPPLTPGEPEE